MRWKYERETIAAYKCCGCVHVRTGTLVLGLLHLLLYILVTSLLVVLLVRPDVLDVFRCHDDIATTTKPTLDSNVTTTVSNRHDRKLLSLNDFKKDDIVVGIILMCCLIAVAVSLLYGTILGRPKHMTAFFCVKLFEICASGMAMLSYFSSTHELRRWIAAQSCFPMKQMMLNLDNNNLMALTLILFVAVMFCKLYVIGVIWACYRYLQQYAPQQHATSAVRRYNMDVVHNADDTEMLLPPKYEDVIAMPRQATGPEPPAYTEEE